MNISEIKLELFRKIESLDDNQLELVYKKILAIINSAEEHKTNREVKPNHIPEVNEKNVVYTRNHKIQETEEIILRAKLTGRAQKSENDIADGNVLSRDEIERRITEGGL